PAEYGRAAKLDAAASLHVPEPVERKVVLPPPHDRIGEHSWACESARDRQVQGLREEDLRQRVAIAILGQELGSDDARDDDRGGPALDDLAHLLADALERVEPLP